MLREKAYYPIGPQGEFSSGDWQLIVNTISSVLGFSTETMARLERNRLAKLIASIPFIANCRQPMRVAMSHVALVVMAAHGPTKGLFDHEFADNQDIYSRLERISHFDGGDVRIIRKGMAMLAYIMLNDHVRDMKSDLQAGKYNPITAGVWDASSQMRQLEREIKTIECTAMDDILTFDEAGGVWWEIP